jgi:hypothetical protein
MNHQLGAGNLAARYTENGEDFSGNKIPASKKASYVEKQTDLAYQKIKAAAAKSDKPMEKISLDFLFNKTDRLEQFIRSKGETPVNTFNGIIIQAMLLRMSDIHVIATAGKLTEDEAFKEIQEAESDAILNSTSDKDLVLAPDTQAALNCLIMHFLGIMKGKAGVSEISDVLPLVKSTNVTPLNNAIGDTIDVSGLQPIDLTLTPGTAGTQGDSTDSFWDTLNKIAATATTVAGSIRDVSSSVSGGILQVGNAVQTTGANTGASAISLYMQRNGITILIIGLLAIVLLIILIRATRN